MRNNKVKKLLRYVMLSLLWGAVAGYVFYATSAARRARGSRSVREIRIEVADSSSQGQLVTSRQVLEWISRGGIPTVGTAVDGVDLAGIERLIARNGFVDEAVAYITYSGVLRIRISQRKPLLRLLTDGRNSYVTAAGYVFAAPQASSLYVPVVTGPYRPPFPASYTGDVRAWIDAELRRIDKRIEDLEREKYPFFGREIKNDGKIADLRRMRIGKRWLESDEEFKERVRKLRAHKRNLRRQYRYEERLIREGIERIEARQETERRQQKKLEKSYEDFMKLLTFAKWVEDDDFWRSEVVQITAHTTPSGALEVDLTPRSGRHVIRFGRIERVEEKFDKLLRFYRSGLSVLGWDTFRTIDVRYEDQVVCRKK